MEVYLCITHSGIQVGYKTYRVIGKTRLQNLPGTQYCAPRSDDTQERHFLPGDLSRQNLAAKRVLHIVIMTPDFY